MRIDLVIRTLVLAPWLAGLIWRGTFDVMAVVLTLSLLALWALPLLRDSRLRHAAAAPAWEPRHARVTP